VSCYRLMEAEKATYEIVMALTEIPH
jgi:hypothetical protein